MDRPMARHTLFAYADGNDLEEVARDLHRAFIDFVGGRKWICPNAWAVNQRHEGDPSVGPGDLPDWELGLNIELPDPGQEPKGWYSDVEATVIFLARLHRSTGRSFAIGISDSRQGISEDLFYVDSHEPDLAELRAIIGVGEIS